MILAGDIGGTKTILALFSTDSDTKYIKKQLFASANYASFTDLLAEFIEDIDLKQLSACCLGVAGPIVNGDCVTTNLPWRLLHKDIAKQLNITKADLLNDLAAIAWGILDLPEQDFVTLNPQSDWKQGNIAVLAAGTGLGEAIIAWDGQQYHVMASEGGHTDFAPNNAQEIELLRYLMQKHPDHVSNERLISGAEGLPNIYEFLKASGFAEPNPEVERQMQESDISAIIGNAGVAGIDKLCVETLNIFCRLYGSEAGNLALKCLPYSGVYLAGGIAAKILPFLKQSQFIERYSAKGRFKSLLNTIPVRVCTHAEVGLLGALYYAKKIK